MTCYVPMAVPDSAPRLSTLDAQSSRWANVKTVSSRPRFTLAASPATYVNPTFCVTAVRPSVEAHANR